MHRYNRPTFDCYQRACSTVLKSKVPDSDLLISPSLLEDADPNVRNLKISLTQLLGLANNSIIILQPEGFRGWLERHFDRGDISTTSVHFLTQNGNLIVSIGDAVNVSVTIASQLKDSNELLFSSKNICSAATLTALLTGSLHEVLYALPYSLNIAILDLSRNARKLIQFVLNLRKNVWHETSFEEFFLAARVGNIIQWDGKSQEGVITSVLNLKLDDMLTDALNVAVNLHRKIAEAILNPAPETAKAIQNDVDKLLDGLSLASLIYAIAGTNIPGVFSAVPIDESTIPYKAELQSLHNFLVTSAFPSQFDDRFHMPKIVNEEEYVVATQRNSIFFLNNHYAKLYRNQDEKLWSDPSARAFVQRQRLISVIARWYAFVIFGYDITNSMAYFGDSEQLEAAINRTSSFIESISSSVAAVGPSGTIDERVVCTSGTMQDGQRMSLGSVVNFNKCTVIPQSANVSIFREIRTRPHIRSALTNPGNLRSKKDCDAILDNKTRIFTIEVNTKLNSDITSRVQEGFYDLLPLKGKIFLSVRIVKNTAFPDQYRNVYLIQIIGGALA